MYKISASFLAITVILALPLVSPSAALASGSFVRPSVGIAGSAKRSLYLSGKGIFNRKIKLTNDVNKSDEQARILEDFSMRLPKSARARANLTKLAGKLDDKQLEALRYYLKIRYRLE